MSYFEQLMKKIGDDTFGDLIDDALNEEPEERNLLLHERLVVLRRAVIDLQRTVDDQKKEAI